MPAGNPSAGLDTHTGVNPVTGASDRRFESRHAWVTGDDGLLFGSGWPRKLTMRFPRQPDHGLESIFTLFQTAPATA